PEVDVVINTAMTGDGKSLAGLLPLLVCKRNILALFPTNELAQDQLRSGEGTLPQWGGDVRDITQISGPILDDLLDAVEHLSRGDVLLRELQNHGFVLSNPDLLHAITQFFYQQFGRAPTHVVSKLPMLFDQITFDEFHIFDAAQITAVLTGLLFLYEQAEHPFKTLFLSATPDERLITPLQKLGFGSRLKVIEPQRENWYAHGANPGDQWRRILHGSDITFVPKNAEEWLADGVQDVLLPWFKKHEKGAKAAIIVNSVATALRLVEQLRAVLPAHLRIEPNTALNGRSTRKASYDADILVGTSTVDVGVDFHINLLIFEASSAGTFMQRLGRLGRHNGYVDAQKQFHQFHAYKAVVLVPLFIYERLTKEIDGQPAKLNEGDVIQRDVLGQIVSAGVFLAPTEFNHYARFWGRFQPAKVMSMLSEKHAKVPFADVRERLKERYKLLTGASMGAAIHDWHSYRATGDELLVSEAQAFRGGSPFQCGVLKPGEGEVLSYDLFWLLANVQLELLSKQAFHAAANMLNISARPAWVKRQRFFFRWQGLLDQREYVTVKLTPTVSRWGEERYHTAQVLPGFTLEGGTQPFLNTLSDALITNPTVALIIPDFEPQQVRRTLYLTTHIPLLAYSNAAEGDPRTGTIAFGRSALLLDSHLRYRKLSCAGGAIFC
ncbi:MAG: type I-D CRISPR-associated helicase Cas3', partial [Chloroflexota bacterium]|nr:type I-D CRISPR-associated helicase Cas3' [Chloroflexota bacterium]